MSQNSQKRAGKYPKDVMVAMTEEMYHELLYHAWDPHQIPGLIRGYLQDRLDVERERASRQNAHRKHRRIIP